MKNLFAKWYLIPVITNFVLTWMGAHCKHNKYKGINNFFSSYGLVNSYLFTYRAELELILHTFGVMFLAT